MSPSSVEWCGTVCVERHGDVGILLLAGALDSGTSSLVDRALELLEATRPHRIIIDLSRLHSVDRSGWISINAATRRYRSEGRALEIVPKPDSDTGDVTDLPRKR